MCKIILSTDMNASDETAGAFLYVSHWTEIEWQHKECDRLDPVCK